LITDPGTSKMKYDICPGEPSCVDRAGRWAPLNLIGPLHIAPDEANNVMSVRTQRRHQWATDESGGSAYDDLHGHSFRAADRAGEHSFFGA
jgi:hypothetical protein